MVGLYPGGDLYCFDPASKGGLMFRQSLAPDSANAFFFLRGCANGPGVQMRTQTGAETDQVYIPPGTWFWPELWVRVTRSNNVFTVYMAGQELQWITLASEYIPMTDPVYVGMAVTSHTNTLLQTS